MRIANVAEVVWYVTGRFYASGESLLDVGYFLHIQGIGEKLFDGARSESTALFTFSATPFTARTVSNGGLDLGIDERGTFSIFLRDAGGASFDDPRSFAAGKCIATFERLAIVPTVKTTTVLMNVFTARLVSSEPFEFAGERYDFSELAPAITQWGTAVTEPLTPPENYSAVVPFAGSAVRAGH